MRDPLNAMSKQTFTSSVTVEHSNDPVNCIGKEMHNLLTAKGHKWKIYPQNTEEI